MLVFTCFRLIDSLDALEDKREKFGPQEERSQDDGGTINEKLKDSLLRTSREHYRHTKQIEVLESSVESLKIALKKSEARNRHLKLNLDELQNSNDDGALPAFATPTAVIVTTVTPVRPVTLGGTPGSAPLPNPPPGKIPTSRHSSNPTDSNASSAGPKTVTPTASDLLKERTQRNRYFGHIDESFQVS
jgi:hypothetical protein